jgi:hypothetical protein
MSASEHRNKTNVLGLEAIVQNSELAIVTPDADLVDYIMQTLHENKLQFDKILVEENVAKTDLSRTLAVIATESSAQLKSADLANLYKTPILLLGNPEDKEKLAKELNVYDIIKFGKQETPEQSTFLGVIPYTTMKNEYLVDSGNLAESLKSAIYKKIELDELCDTFPKIKQWVENEQVLNDERHYVAEGDHGRTDEEKAKYWVRGRARNISRFEAAHLAAMAQVEDLKRGLDEIDFARLLQLYTNLYENSKLEYFEGKIKELLEFSHKKGAGKWLFEQLDPNEKNIAYAWGLWCADHPHMMRDLAKISRYHNDIIEYQLGEGQGLYVFKLSPAKKLFLRKERQIVNKLRELNNTVKGARNIGKYVQFPHIARYMFSDSPDKNDFLMLQRMPGKSVYDHIAEFDDKLKGAKNPRDFETISRQKEKLIDLVLREIAKVDALGYAMSRKSPDLISKVHGREYHREKFEMRLIGKPGVEEYAELSEKGRFYQEYKGGLATLITDASQLEHYRKEFIENSAPLVDIISSLETGIVTDRNTLNINKKKKGRVYMLDFENVYDLPAWFELAAASRACFASEAEIILKEDLFFGDKKVASKGDVRTKNQVYIATFNNYLQEELEFVGEAIKDKQLKKIKLANDFEEAQKNYYAISAQYNLIGFGRLLQLSMIQSPKYFRGADKTLVDARSDISQLKKFYANDEQVTAKLGKLDTLCREIRENYFTPFREKYEKNK